MALVWYVASLVTVTAVVFYKLGRVAGLVDGYQQGRAERLDEHLTATADRLRAVTYVETRPPADWDRDGWLA